MFKIVLIKIQDRSKNSTHVQEILTKYGCNIKVRLGLHEAENHCSNEGLIILELTSYQAGFIEDLESITSVSAKYIEI